MHLVPSVVYLNCAIDVITLTIYLASVCVCVSALALHEQPWPCVVYIEFWMTGGTNYDMPMKFVQMVNCVICCFTAVSLNVWPLLDILQQWTLFKVFFCRGKTYLKCIIKLDYITSGCRSFLLNKARIKNTPKISIVWCTLNGIYFLSSALYVQSIDFKMNIQSSAMKQCSYVSTGSIKLSL